MALKTGGSEGTNMLFGLGGRVLGGVVGYLAGGPSGAQAGWGLGGQVGDSFSSPMEYTSMQRDVAPIDVNQQYQQKRLTNRQSNFREVTSERPGWAPAVLGATDMAVNIVGTGLGMAKKGSATEKWYNSGSPLFGNGAVGAESLTPTEKTYMNKGSSESQSVELNQLMANPSSADIDNVSTSVIDVNKSINDMTKQINKSWLKRTRNSGGLGSGTYLPQKIEDYEPTSGLFKPQNNSFLTQGVQFNPYT